MSDDDDGPLPGEDKVRSEMTLPTGKTCGDCAHIRRCTMFGFTPAPTETMCSFHPSRFRAPPATTPEST